MNHPTAPEQSAHTTRAPNTARMCVQVPAGSHRARTSQVEASQRFPQSAPAPSDPACFSSGMKDPPTKYRSGCDPSATMRTLTGASKQEGTRDEKKKEDTW